jgi:hypothetical protein
LASATGATSARSAACAAATLSAALAAATCEKLDIELKRFAGLDGSEAATATTAAATGSARARSCAAGSGTRARAATIAAASATGENGVFTRIKSFELVCARRIGRDGSERFRLSRRSRAALSATTGGKLDASLHETQRHVRSGRSIRRLDHSLDAALGRVLRLS